MACFLASRLTIVSLDIVPLYASLHMIFPLFVFSTYKYNQLVGAGHINTNLRVFVQNRTCNYVRLSNTRLSLYNCLLFIYKPPALGVSQEMDWRCKNASLIGDGLIL